MTCDSATDTAARGLLQQQHYGCLSSHSSRVPGYPFGSIVPYCLDRQGRALMLISTLAQHTHNIQADPRVSLLVQQAGREDVQAAARLTLLADALPLPRDDEDSAARYYRFFPEARDYHKTHDFNFYLLTPVHGRYIGGFGDIHWLAAEQVTGANPFSGQQEQGMVEHMNADHADAMRHYCRTAGIAPDQAPEMAGIDGDGFNLRLGARPVRFAFEAPVTTPMEVRKMLAAMAHRP